MPEAESIPRRAVPGTSIQASEIGFRFHPSVLGPPSSEDRTIALLQRARSRGITTFDVGSGSHSHRAERLLAKAFPTPDPGLLILIGRSLTDLVAESNADRSGSPEATVHSALERSVHESRSRLGSQSVGLIEWQPSTDPTVGAEEVRDALTRLKADGKCGGWVWGTASRQSVLEVGGGGGASATLLSGRLSPLDRELLAPLVERSSLAPLGFFAHDPFGQGKLDGTLFARSLADRRPDARPLNVRELQREFDPVLRLGFLTRGTRRSLAQASLRFVLRWPWVCCALVPLPTPERLDELLAAEGTPELTDLEVERILAISP